MRRLHIDVETYSSVDIKKAGTYAYVESPDFEILCLTYGYDGWPLVTLDLKSDLGEDMPKDFIAALTNPSITKVAHNANFERTCFNKALKTYLPIEQWECTLVKAAYCGLQLGLDDVAKAIGLKNQKDKKGKALMVYFSTPCKPTARNGMRTRNLPEHDMAAWQGYLDYNRQDVATERELDERLSRYEWPKQELPYYVMDQQINDRGIEIDLTLAEAAMEADDLIKSELSEIIKRITGVQNANSDAQIKDWILRTTGKTIKSFDKKFAHEINEQVSGTPAEGVLKLRSQLNKSSIAKYSSMVKGRSEDGRCRGLFQFYGAMRTGRFAGRRVQLQNLPKNFLQPLGFARKLIRSGQYQDAEAIFGDVSNVLSQLIRTALVPSKGNILSIADFSAIEARVTAWVADEKWRLEVFATTGKIYEASAEMMFHLPKGSVGKHNPARARGKVAELALGYGGTTEALKVMDYEHLLDEKELPEIVRAWREASPNIVKLWYDLEGCAKKAVTKGGEWTSKFKSIRFKVEGDYLTMALPSGRKLYYYDPKMGINRFGGDSLTYMGVNSRDNRNVWERIETWGGKLAENCIQAVSRDLLCSAMLKIEEAGLPIVLHVHDEAAVEVPVADGKAALDTMLAIMAEPIPWADGLLLKGEGFLTEYYKKD